jgi:hypothetical protein
VLQSDEQPRYKSRKRVSHGNDFFGEFEREGTTSLMMLPLVLVLVWVLVLVLMRIRTNSRWKIMPPWIILGDVGTDAIVDADVDVDGKAVRRKAKPDGCRMKGSEYVLPLSTFAFQLGCVATHVRCLQCKKNRISNRSPSIHKS